MNTRLQQFLSAENISQSQFADTLGVARANISHIMAGRNKPGYDFICNLMRSYPTLNIEGLLLGKGKMYSKTPSIVEEVEEPQLFSPRTEETFDNTSSESLFSAAPAPAPPQQQNPVQEETPSSEQETPRSDQHKIIRVLALYEDGTWKEIC